MTAELDCTAAFSLSMVLDIELEAWRGEIP
jgi:hypothetical protein